MRRCEFATYAGNTNDGANKRLRQNTLDFSCACVAQVSFNISDYNGSIPAFECTTWIQQCVLQSSVNGTEQQQQCLSHSCGTKDAVALPVGSDATSVGSATSTAASSASSAASRTSSTSSGASTTATSSSSTTPAAIQPPQKPGASGGTIAGAAIGALLGLTILLFLLWYFVIRPRRKRGRKINGYANGGRATPTTGADEKQVAVPIASEISQKPELYGHPIGQPNGAVAELYVPPHQHRMPGVQQASECYPAAEVPGQVTPYHDKNQPINQDPVELHSSIQGWGTEAHTPPNAAASSVTATEPHATSEPTPAEKDITETGATSPAPSIARVRQLSPEEIAQLEEEERRIDAELEEVKRVKELREQKLSIQRKLWEARSG